MERTISIDGRDVKFRSSGKFPILYRAYTGRSFFKDFDDAPAVMTSMDTEILEDMIWCAAKLAAEHDGQKIQDELEWYDSFESFNYFDVFVQLHELLVSCFKQLKKA